MDSMSIRFGNVPGIVAPLEVEGPEGSHSVEQLCAVLFAMRVQVLRAEEEHGPGRVVRRLGVCEFHGGPLSARRRRLIAAEIAATLDAASLAHPPLSRTAPAAARRRAA